MAKDPAFMLYSQDFLVGVSDLTMEERGQYITLLCTEHQKGRLSKKVISLTVGNVSEDVLSKFDVDEDGLYYNERLEEELEKRARYSQSRSENGSKGGRPPKDASAPRSENHMQNHMETICLPYAKPYGKAYGNHTENENENRNIIKKSNIKKEFVPPTYEDVLAYAKSRGREDLARKFYDYFTAAEWVDSNGKPVIRWKAKFITWENNSEKPQEKASSFDTEDFFQAALRRTYGDSAQGGAQYDNV